MGCGDGAVVEVLLRGGWHHLGDNEGVPCAHPLIPPGCRGAGEGLSRSQHPQTQSQGCEPRWPQGTFSDCPDGARSEDEGENPTAPCGVTSPRSSFVSEPQNGLGWNGFKAQLVPSSAMGPSHWTRLLQAPFNLALMTLLGGIWGH